MKRWLLTKNSRSLALFLPKTCTVQWKLDTEKDSKTSFILTIMQCVKAMWPLALPSLLERISELIMTHELLASDSEVHDWSRLWNEIKPPCSERWLQISSCDHGCHGKKKRKRNDAKFDRAVCVHASSFCLRSLSFAVCSFTDMAEGDNTALPGVCFFGKRKLDFLSWTRHHTWLRGRTQMLGRWGQRDRFGKRCENKDMSADGCMTREK